MRTSESKIAEALLHPEEEIRLTALRYFSQSPCADRTLMPRVIQAVEQYGRGAAAVSLLRAADALPQTPETVAWLTGELAKEWDLEDVGNDNYCFSIGLILCETAVELLRPEMADLPSFPIELEDRFRCRVDMQAEDLSWEQAWEALEDCGRAARRRDEWRLEDSRWASTYVERLARHRDQAHVVLNLLHRRYRGYDRELVDWLDASVVELAGKMRLAEAIPPIVERLHGNDWDLANECETALMAIGGDAVVDAIVAHWDVEDDEFRRAAADILEYVHSDRSLHECLARFAEQDEDEEEQVDTKVFLANALLGQFADEALGPVRQWLLEIEDDESADIHDLRERLVAIATVMGVSFPEYEVWYADAVQAWSERTDLDGHRIRDNFGDDEDDADDEEWDDEDTYWDDDEDEDLDAVRRRPLGFSPEELVAPPRPQADPYLPLKPIRNAAPPVGRNDPCPCGSGKKYKKCCLGKERDEP